jgi:hypothetical protein
MLMLAMQERGEKAAEKQSYLYCHLPRVVIVRIRGEAMAKLVRKKYWGKKEEKICGKSGDL